MEFFKILVGGLLGTTLMTFFSYFCSQLFDKEFGEPKLLNKLLARSRSLDADIQEDSLVGWVLHFVLGFLFAWMMHFYFLCVGNPPSLIAGAILGLLLGILGALGWAILLSLHKSPPKVERAEFYSQLVVAHIIFGMGAVLAFKLFVTS